MEKSKILRMYEIGTAKVCNCAECRQELLGSCHEVDVEMAGKLRQLTAGLPPIVEGRIEGRPYCYRCFIALGGNRIGRLLAKSVAKTVAASMAKWN